MVYIHFIFLEYTYARDPWEYCNNIESPPAYLVSFDKNGIPQFKVNTMYNTILVHPFTVNEFFNVIDESASSSPVANGKD